MWLVATGLPLKVTADMPARILIPQPTEQATKPSFTISQSIAQWSWAMCRQFGTTSVVLAYALIIPKPNGAYR